MTLGMIAVAMMAFVHTLSNVAVSYDIQHSIERKLYKNSKNMYIDEEGEVAFVWKEDDISFLVINETGKVLAGEYPVGCPKDIGIVNRRFLEVKEGSETFYVQDIRKHLKNERYVYLRGVVRRSDIYSRYQTLEYLACLSILVISGIAILFGIVLSRRISNSLKEMCQVAEKIGADTNDMSERMEYHGRVYELMVLTKANNRMLDRLEEMFLQQEQFTSDVAHELRTPVSVITAQCQFARKKSTCVEDYQEALEVIDRHSTRMNVIISRLLELSRLDLHRMQMKKEEVDLPEIIQSICEDMQREAGDTLNIQLELSEARTVGDLGLIMIAIQNLLTNAVRYSAPGSPVEVKTGKMGGMVFVSVKDFGAGISEENLAHIFKRFYKVDKSRHSEGFGLGLPLTLKIAQKHGGTVAAKSILDEGSTFTLLLP